MTVKLKNSIEFLKDEVNDPEYKEKRKQLINIKKKRRLRWINSDYWDFQREEWKWGNYQRYNKYNKRYSLKQRGIIYLQVERAYQMLSQMSEWPRYVVSKFQNIGENEKKSVHIMGKIGSKRQILDKHQIFHLHQVMLKDRSSEGNVTNTIILYLATLSK